MEISAEARTKWRNSLVEARKIEADDFFSYCDQLNEKLLESRLEYNPEMTIPVFPGEGKKFIVYVIEENTVKEISLTKNLPQFFGQRLNCFLKNAHGFSISFDYVPELIAETVRIRLCLQHRISDGLAVAIHTDSPVYVSKNRLKEYIEAAYGIEWRIAKSLIKRHYELTEINLFDFTLYIKQELDQIIRLEAASEVAKSR